MIITNARLKMVEAPNWKCLLNALHFDNFKFQTYAQLTVHDVHQVKISRSKYRPVVHCNKSFFDPRRTKCIKRVMQSFVTIFFVYYALGI